MSNDPDDMATAEAAVVLKTLLRKEHNTEVTNAAARWLAFSTICKWVERRSHHWAVRRGRAGFGMPDAMMVGFAEASLVQIADKASGLPMDKPIGKWSKADAARLFAVAWEAIEATRVQTLEDPSETEAMPA